MRIEVVILSWYFPRLDLYNIVRYNDDDKKDLLHIPVFCHGSARGWELEVYMQ